jgi:hypothetical protein
MRRLLFPLIFGFVVATTAAWSAAIYRESSLPGESTKKPWTAQPFNNGESVFRFAIVSDRTGGHREGIFAKAVAELNLLQPEFVVSVGDLVEGYNDKQPTVDAMWKEFDTYVSKLQMPFFHVPGNHDMATSTLVNTWKSKFGTAYYHFVYKNVLFLCGNTDDYPQGKKATTQISQEQNEYFSKVLNENKNVHWTIVLLHKPIWTLPNPDEIGWTGFEKLLLDRPYTVFAGHIHHYEKFVRHGRNYYQLATTGGGSKLRGIRYGEFDHITWVTMKQDGPVLANLLLSGILPEDLTTVQAVAPEKGTVIKDRRVCYQAEGSVLADGKPVENAEVVFYYIVPPEELLKAGGKKLLRSSDGATDANGRFTLSTYTNDDGIPAGEFIVTVVPFKSRTGLPINAPTLDKKYAKPDTSPLRVKIKEGKNDIKLELQSG